MVVLAETTKVGITSSSAVALFSLVHHKEIGFILFISILIRVKMQALKNVCELLYDAINPNVLELNSLSNTYEAGI
jgi:hypothetical protein